MRKNYYSAILLPSALFLIFATSCKRESVIDPSSSTHGAVNDLTQVTASVSGIVLDENNAPIASAVVTSGAATVITNSNGMFIFQNISVSKENGSITVVKAGYFKGIRSFKTTAGKNHTVRLQLMQKVLSGTINTGAGGTINSNGGATIVFPAAAFVTSTGVAYAGTVNVYSRWINPTAANLSFIIPGDLRGVDTTGAENLLETYGMVGAVLEDASGNTLKIATGKTATIRFPLPASLQASAPATIKLWHFDDATARWKENGTATRTGNTYAAQVDKFSFWNCDVANADFINLDYTLVNATTNSPLVSTSTRIKRVSDGSYEYGITNNTGFVSGLVPKNEALVLEVISNCNAVIYSQNIGPFSNNTGLGNVSVTLSNSEYTHFTGALLNCSGAAVSNGYILFFAAGGYGVFANSNASGALSFSILNCSGGINYNVQGFDQSTAAQSPVVSGIATSGTFNLGNLTACGIASGPGIYVAGTIGGTAVVWKNGQPISLTNGSAIAGANSVFVSGTDIYVAGFEGNTAKIWKNGIPTNLTTGGNDNSALSVFVSGNDVYVAGVAYNGSSAIAKLWKNGVATNLSTGGIYTTATSVFVAGTDVYVAGREDAGAGSIVKIWKNGVANNVGNPPVNGYISSLFVSGTDVYVAGSTGGFGGNSYYNSNNIWKNGVATNIYTVYSNNNVFYDGGLTSVFVNGSDVYATGFTTVPLNTSNANFVGQVWKNGVAANLTNGSSDGRAESVFVLGSDVYVAGTEGNFAKLWKNGIPVTLNNAGGASSSARSVFVK